MQNAQQFAQRVQSEKNSLQELKNNDLMKIAQMAGLGDRMKPKVNVQEGDDDFVLDKFEDDLFEDEEGEDGEPLDVRVY